MANVNIELGYKNLAWFTTNPTLVLLAGQIVYLEQTGTYKIGDGVTQLSVLSFLGISSETQTLQNVTDLGNVTTNNIEANSFIKTGGVSTDVLLADGSTTTLVTKTSDLTNDGDDGNPFISLNDLPSSLTLYATNAASDIPTYFKLVSSITDPSYNTTPVNIPTGTITTTGQLIATLATSANVIVGNPGIFNITTIGNIQKLSGTGNAEFYFEVWQRTLAGVETLITVSGSTLPVLNSGYAEFSASALWNNGSFLSTDRIVLKYYADRIITGSDPTYQFQFGGLSPVRSLVPIPLNVVPVLKLDELQDVTAPTPTNNDILTYESSTSLWKNKTVVSALGFTPYNATNPSGYITSSALTGLVPYTGATANVNLGVYELSTPKLNGSKINLIGTDNALDGIFLSNSTFVNVPNLGVSANSVSLNARGFSLSNDTAVLTGSYITSFGMGLAVGRAGGLVSLKNTVGYSLLVESGNVGILTSNPFTPLQVAGNITTTWGDFNIGTFYQSGTDYKMGFNTITSQRQLNLHAYSVDTGGYITFSTGTNAVPFVNARINPKQTSGSLSNFIFTKPDNTGQTASASIAGFNYVGGTRQWLTGAITTQSENVWGATTYSFVGASTITNAYGNVFNAPIAGTNATITNNWAAQFNGNVVIGSTGQLIEIKQTANAPTYTQTGASSSYFTIKSGTRILEFASFAGDLNYFTSTGPGFAISSTTLIKFQTNGIERLNISSTGNFFFLDSGTLQFGTTIGTKIGTATTQKLSFWNATPIVQPATGGTASTFVANTSGILNDTATFDGYTIGQVVKALRNMGLLA